MRISSTRFLLSLLIVLLIGFSSCRQNSPQHFFKNGSAKYQLKDYSGAIKDLSEAITLDPDYADAYYVRAICHSELSQTDQALNDFNKVIELDPGFKDAYVNRAFYVKEKKGDYEGAILDYNKFIELNTNGDNAFALNNRGFSKYKLGLFEEALTDVDKSIQFDPKNAFAYKNRALIFIEMDSINKVCSDLNRAIELGFTQNYGNEASDLQRQYCENN
ncbi:MAG: tetratricopeptide repeat protein [Bacteroidales bacterium]